jgi:hypothetical protein
MLIAREAPLLADSFRVGAPLSQPRPPHKPAARRAAASVVKTVFTIVVYHDAREVGDIVMIALVALLNVSQPLPWLDRNWINHQARREMLVAASASSFDRPRPHLPIQLLDWPHARPRLHALLGGPSGM